MPKKNRCLDCGKVCFGIRCQPCSGPHKRKWKNKGDAQRNQSLRFKYGIDLDEFEAWWIVQLGKCGICDRKMIRPLKQKGQPLDTVCVDHDHETGKVRGLLCSACNKGLGLFEDQINRLERAKEWLK